MTQWAGRALRPLAAGTVKSGVTGKAKPEDNITVVPSCGRRPDYELKTISGDEIDDISDKVDYYGRVVDNAYAGANSTQSARRAEVNFRAPRATRPMSWNISTEKPRANAGAGLAGKYSGANAFRGVYRQGYAHGRVGFVH